MVCLALVGAARGEEPAAESGPSLKKILEKLPFGLHGFVEARAGSRLQKDPAISETASIAETRLQLEASKLLDLAEVRVKGDIVYDAVEEEAKGELRSAFVLLTPFEIADVKIGRQVLTWGTGDLLFINDLFPKDWKSFFIGRDDEYLKAPSDAVRISYFHPVVNVDFVYTPRFRADTYIDGDRLSYWSDALGRRVGEGNKVRASEPDDWIGDDEIALRLHRNLRGTELALYGYHGYWRTPAGMNPRNGRATFPDLSVLGASARGAVGKGIGNIEAGYYHSRDDSDGDNPFVRNSELRILVGYEQEIARNLTAGVQYYVEWMMDYGGYRRMLPAGVRARDEFRHLVTLRLTKLLMSQNLKLSFFAYYSPSDDDAYLRPKIHYKIDDHWAAEIGGNIFLGARDHTFFGMFERDTNAYAAVRYSF